jgi:hypothetical protein
VIGFFAVETLMQMVTLAGSLLIVGIWIVGLVFSLRVRCWYAAAGGFLVVGTGLSAIAFLMDSAVQACSTFYLLGYIEDVGEDLGSLFYITYAAFSFLLCVGFTSLLTGLWLICKRCRELQLTE